MQKQNYISLLNDSLKVFFKDAVRVTWKDPAQAIHFLKTVHWQTKATRRRTKAAQNGIHVPPIMIFSITHKCNLHCKGCYAKALDRKVQDELPPEEIDRIIGEARDLGTSFFVLAGGEPFMRKDLLDMTARYPDIIFLVFTNGLLIDDDRLKKIKKQRNVVPVISLEGHEAETDDRRGVGVYDHLRSTVKRLHDAGIFFSVSLTVTQMNLNTVIEESFIQDLFDKGCKLFFFLEYTAIHEGTEDWMPNNTDRQRLNRTVARFREKIPALFISVPGDEEEFGGCLSAGRGFLHITPEGQMEPCPFAPFSDTSVRDVSVEQALQSKLLSVIRQNADKLEEGEGGCTLWQQREWVMSLLEQEG